MHHTFYAVFDNAAAAERAVAELRQVDAERNHCSVALYQRMLNTGSGTKPDVPYEFADAVIHRDVTAGGELHNSESAMRRGAVSGAVAGTVLGGLAAVLVAGPVGAVVGGALGLLGGGVMGGLATAHGPDPTLEKLGGLLHDEQVLLSVEAPDLRREGEEEAIVERHGGTIHHRLPV